MQVSDIAVTADAGSSICTRMFSSGTFDGFDDIRMTMAARAFGNFLIARRDPDGVLVGAGGEIERMPEAIQSFGLILADKIVWGMTIVARRHAAMAALDPAVVLFLHEVAIDASLGIIGQVGSPFRVKESVGADAQCNPHHHAHDYPGNGRAFGRPTEMFAQVIHSAPRN